MEDLYEGIELNETQTALLCRGLLDLAAVDGIHPAEMALIEEFYASGDGDGDRAGLDALKAKGFDLAKVGPAIKLGGSAVVESFLLTCYLLIYADGEHSDEERVRIGQYADALDTGRDKLEELHVKARIYLLQQFAASLTNKDAVKMVGASLGLEDAHINAALEG
jgi:hypothetical protein